METKNSADLSPTTKKMKKSKSKKSKTQIIENDDSGDLVIAEEVNVSKPVKIAPTTAKPLTTNMSTNKKRKKRDSASSDEERWLTAIESGKLEDVDDELKKIKPKDPALMTARQRAMYDRGSDGTPCSAPTLMSLPSGYKEKVMTAEAIQKAAIKSQKRKQLADEKREKDKKKTMERLLKKQESKSNKSTKIKTSRTSDPVIIYRQNIFSTTITFPLDIECPLKTETIKNPAPLKYCSVGCGNLKKYSCAQTGAYLCSLKCYKKNISKMII